MSNEYNGWVQTKGGVWKKTFLPKNKNIGKKKKKDTVKKRNRALVKERFKKSRQFIDARKQSELSVGEYKIAEFLKNNGIYFIREYFTTYCYNWKTQHLLFFDFYLPDQKAAIEFDGQHHFKPVYGADKLIEQKYKDGRKNKYCLKNGIKLLRIPYWEGNKIDAIICKWFDDNF